MFLAYGCRLWIKLCLLFACERFFCLFLLCLVGIFLNPFNLLVHDRRCLLLTTILGWLVKTLARHRYVTAGWVWGGYRSSSFVQIACGRELPLRGVAVGFFSFFLSSHASNPQIYWEVGYFHRWGLHLAVILLTEFSELCLNWFKSKKPRFWEKGEKAQEPLILIRPWSSPTSVMQLVHNYIWRLEWNFWIRHCRAMSSVKKKFKSVCIVKFSEAN